MLKAISGCLKITLPLFEASDETLCSGGTVSITWSHHNQLLQGLMRRLGIQSRISGIKGATIRWQFRGVAFSILGDKLDVSQRCVGSHSVC